MRLYSNKIETIDDDAFLDMKRLYLLDLSKNSLTKVRKALNNLTLLGYLFLEVIRIELVEQKSLINLANLLALFLYMLI